MYTISCGIPSSLFGEDHPSFLIDLRLFQPGPSGIIGDDQEAFFEFLFRTVGQNDMVFGLLVGGMGIGIAPEIHADRLKVIDQAVGRKIGGSLEHHMFEEMSHAPLVVLFVQGPCLDIEIDGDPVVGFAVFL
ncbi:MAG: hypothetical protein ACD_75C00413G0002 [uncultured bacterium]|nr:MAG: hypothetical protein ACD_75C00413G0002 [uncultured bacterium]